MQIPFNKPPLTGIEQSYVLNAISSHQLSGDGYYGIKCQSWFEKHLNCTKALLTPSCTHALEMAAILINIQPGDEVIMPSYTFVSTANAFVLRGARIVFVDIRPDTMNINEEIIEDAITLKTRAIVPVHYAGVACDMDKICTVARRHNLFVIEDAAQGMMASYNNKPLGTLGHLAAYSFHETKNITSGGEGGLLIVNDDQFLQRAEIIREKGTNRNQFFRGMIDKYSWVDLGSSYLPSELQSAYLWGQLEEVQSITADRLSTWNLYYSGLKDLELNGRLELPVIPKECRHNGHMFYIKCANLDQRTALLSHLKAHNIAAVFHYVPLHTSAAAKIFSSFYGEDIYTTRVSERLVRLPMWYGMSTDIVERVINAVKEFYV